MVGLIVTVLDLLCFPFYPGLPRAMIHQAEIVRRWPHISVAGSEDLRSPGVSVGCSLHRQYMCLRMWRCYAEGVGCRTSSVRPRVEISVFCRGGLQWCWTSLHLVGSFKGCLTLCLTTADPHRITKKTGLLEGDTAASLVLGKRGDSRLGGGVDLG